MKTMALIIFYCLIAIAGFTTASAYVLVNDWQYWVIIFCIIFAYCCGLIRGSKL